MTAIEKVQQELNKVFTMQDQLQKEVWTKENYQINSMREDMLSEISSTLSEVLRTLEEQNEDLEYISLNER
jgi:predicted metal-dependent hydrolase